MTAQTKRSRVFGLFRRKQSAEPTQSTSSQETIEELERRVFGYSRECPVCEKQTLRKDSKWVPQESFGLGIVGIIQRNSNPGRYESYYRCSNCGYEGN